MLPKSELEALIFIMVFCCWVQSRARGIHTSGFSPFSSGLRSNKQTFNPADTNALVAAVAFGKGLSNWRPSGSSGPGQPGQPGAGTILAGTSGLQQVQMTGAPSQQQSILSGVQMAQAGQPGKVAGIDIVADLEQGSGNKPNCLSLHIPRAGDFLPFS